MSKGKRALSASESADLFDRIVAILEQSRGNVVRAVNTNMVLAYWKVLKNGLKKEGSESATKCNRLIVQAEQRG